MMSLRSPIRSTPARIDRALRVSRETCVDYERSSRLEWLETDGLGGFAMGTVAGVNTRRYHGLLVAALRPPVERHVLLSRLQESLEYAGHETALSTAQYPDVVAPRGFERIEQFCLYPFPTWTYLVDGARLEKKLFMVHGERTVVVRYRSERACTLRVRPLVAFRDFHALTHANDVLDRRVWLEPGKMRIRPYTSLPEMTIHHTGVASEDGAAFYYRHHYEEERARGLDFEEDLYMVGTLAFELPAGGTAWLLATIDGGAWDDARVDAKEAAERERRAVKHADPLVARLARAADAFVVRREGGGPTIIAGYPWFSDWGRDSMIALPGLLLARGRIAEAEEVLRGFLQHLDQGLIPNRFPDHGERPEYNTVDATLWLFHAVDALLAAGGDPSFVRDTFYPKGKEILAWHARGTHHGIRVDSADGLLEAGGPGTQLTWMDAKVGDWVVTPRHGKPVEVNALYHNALRVMEAFGTRFGDPDAARYRREADRVAISFRRAFWDAEHERLYDVIRADGPDPRMRPNQIFAVSLPNSMLSPSQMRAVVRSVEKELLTPYGLRTLSPNDPEYRPAYGGDPLRRDGAYHQGTVWPWLLGPFVTAYLRAFGRTAKNVAYATALVEGLARHTTSACLGTVSEVVDADVPHAPGGAPAQAWSVAELLRILCGELARGM